MLFSAPPPLKFNSMFNRLLVSTAITVRWRRCWPGMRRMRCRQAGRWWAARRRLAERERR